MTADANTLLTDSSSTGGNLTLNNVANAKKNAHLSNMLDEEERYLLFKLALCLGFQPRFALINETNGRTAKAQNEFGEELMFRRESVCYAFNGHGGGGGGGRQR